MVSANVSGPRGGLKGRYYEVIRILYKDYKDRSSIFKYSFPIIVRVRGIPPARLYINIYIYIY